MGEKHSQCKGAEAGAGLDERGSGFHWQGMDSLGSGFEGVNFCLVPRSLSASV